MIPPQILVVGGGVLLLAGLFGGWTVRDWKADSDTLAATKDAREHEDAARAAIWSRADKREQDRETGAQQLATDRTTIREYYRDAPPVPANCAAPAPVVGVLERAVAAANAAAIGQSVAALPADPGAAESAHR